MSTEIERGALIEVQDVTGHRMVRRALGGVVDWKIGGDHLAVVWACSGMEWEAAQAEGREAKGDAWPVWNVRVLEA
jgi:hypothetical protein